MHTSPKVRPLACAATLIAVAALVPAPAFGQNSSLAFISEPGDPIGQGQSLTLRDVEIARISESEIRLGASNGDQFFNLTLTAPDGRTLRRRAYENVVRAGSGPVAQPGLSFSGNNNFCESIEGRFEIEEVRFAAFGYVEHLRANFEQRCDGSTATLFGDVVINNPPKPREMRLRMRVDSQALLVDDEVQPSIWLTCDYRAGGRVIATLQQEIGPGNVITRRSYQDQAGCSPKSGRLFLPVSAGGDPDFRPGSATLNVEVRMEDPNYAEFETDAQVIRTASKKIRIRLP